MARQGYYGSYRTKSVKVPREQCEALKTGYSYPGAPKPHGRCPLRVTYIVGTKRLCRHHALWEAMGMAVERGVVTRLAIPYESIVNKRVRTVRKSRKG